MTRGGVLPGEDAVARIESEFPKTTAGALAKIVHARIKINAKDFAGAAALLDASVIRDYTVIPDYALSMKASALEQANRHVEARAAYEQVARDYPNSLRAREALLQDARLFTQDGQAGAIPVALKQLAAKDDAAALLLTAKAFEQTGNSTAALAGYLRDIGWPHGNAIEIVQGEDMGMRSRIRAEISPVVGASIRVSGTARVLSG